MRATIALRGLIVALGLVVALKGGQLVQTAPMLFAASLPAMAAAAQAASPPAPAPTHATPSIPATPPPAAQPAPDDAAAAPETLAAALRARREALEARERTLAMREAVLAAAERRLDARIGELTSLQSRLEQANNEVRERDEAHWRGLARLYEMMRPREAATVLNELDLPVLTQVVDRMGERKAAPILAAMLPERVRQVTLELARLRAARQPG